MQGHFPFGEMWYDSGATKWKFTTHERDSESGNDYAMARYDVSRLGRFSAPDPLAGSTISPQSLNRYSYVANDPINYHDPSGQFLTALTLFLDRMGFPNAWGNFDEFALFEGELVNRRGDLVQIGGGYLLEPDGYGDSFDADSLIRKRLKNFKKSHCNQVFAGHIADYSSSEFLQSVNSTNIYDVPSPNSPFANFTQDDVSGNGNGTSLYRTVYSHDAVTIINGDHPAIILGANFFGLSTADEANDLFHEELHAYTLWNDEEIFANFADAGLQHNNPGTADISSWLKNDCRSTQ